MRTNQDLRTIGGPSAERAMRHLQRCIAKPRAPRPLSREGFVYFVGPADGPIKIGFSSDPRERLYRLQTGHAERLYLWAQAPGGKLAEDRYQARFADAWISGEWFERTPELLAEIERLSSL